jgi:cytochrome P450
MSFAHVPPVPGENLLGHAHLFQTDRLGFLRTAAARGAVTRIRFLHRAVLLASSPETAHQILVEQARSFEKSPGLRLALRELAGDGLFTSEGALWQRQRRLMSPLFHTTQLAGYAETMHAIALRAVERLRDGETVDLAREMTHITMSVVATTLFGADTEERADEIGDALSVALRWVNDVLTSTPLMLQVTALEVFETLQPVVPAPLAELRRRIEEALEEPWILPGQRDPELRDAIRTLDRRMKELIDERRAHPRARADLLTKLLLARDLDAGASASANNDAANGAGTSGAEMTDKQVRDEANTLFVAGHETTANTLAWAFHLLARHPEARARVQAEADAFEPAASTVAAHAEKLDYTTRVFKETLRLYPPVVVLPRRAIEPFELAGARYPAGALVFVSPYGVHMSPAIWPEPERFEPDRFLSDREAARHKAAWLPFGLGPRVCIGAGFALLEGPIVLATLMKHARFDIDASRDLEADAFATLRPRGGVFARVHLQR